MLTAKDIKKFIAEVPDDTYVTIRDGYITCVFHDHVVSLNRVGAKWTENVAIIEEECVNKPKDVGLTIDEAGPTLGDKVEEVNSKFTRSFAEIGIDIEGKDLLEIMAADLELCYAERMGVSKFYPDYDAMAEKMYNIGYRQQNAIIDEFVKRLKDTSMTKWDYHEAVDVDEIDRVAAIMKGDMN